MVSRRALKWYHWTSLTICSAWMLAMGVPYVTGGAAPTSRFYAIDSVLVPMIGVGLIVLALGLFSRRSELFVSSICLLVLAILEIVIFPSRTDYSYRESLIRASMIVGSFGVPIALLVWLRRACFGAVRPTQSNLARTADVSAGAVATATRATPSAEERYPVEFTAAAGEYFRIWIVNLGLTIVTLGIYSAWAKVRKRRYLYSHTRIGGEGFEYRAKPLPILKGRLFALGLLVVWFAAGHFVPILAAEPALRQLAFVVVAVIAGPWVLVRSLKFNAHNTAYRNIRLRFGATYAGCLKIVAVYGWLVLLPILYPYFKRRLVQFAAENHFYGTTQFTVLDFKKPFIHAYAVAYGLFGLAFFLVIVLIVAVGQAVAFREGAPVQFVIALYVCAALMFAYIRARTVNAVWNSIRIGAVRFESVLRARDLIGLYVSNVAAIVLTLGLATPWAVVRTHRYRASKTMVITSGPLDSFLQAEAQQISATGEEVGEMFDFDIAL